jgi:hypothetical protein
MREPGPSLSRPKCGRLGVTKEIESQEARAARSVRRGLQRRKGGLFSETGNRRRSGASPQAASPEPIFQRPVFICSGLPPGASTPSATSVGLCRSGDQIHRCKSHCTMRWHRPSAGGLMPSTLLLVALVLRRVDQDPRVAWLLGWRQGFASRRVGLFAGPPAPRPYLFVDSRPRGWRAGWQSFTHLPYSLYAPGGCAPAAPPPIGRTTYMRQYEVGHKI